jgi:uncharacterized SAM-binding protein YcdF (DUF218 family)
MARRARRFRRTRFRALRWFVKLLAALCLLWGIGFLVFLGVVFTASPPNPLPPADGIIALTGGHDRVAAGLALLAEHEAPRLLISGAGRGTYLGDFTADDTAAATKYAADITLGHMAATTHGNALEAATWAHEYIMQSLIIVTADYHMPRALLEIQHALPDVTLIPAPVRPPAMSKFLSVNTLRLLAAEYTKFLVVRAGLSDVWAGLTGS